MKAEKIIVQAGKAISMAEARRIVVQGALKINGLVVELSQNDIPLHEGDVIQIGRHASFSFDGQSIVPKAVD